MMEKNWRWWLSRRCTTWNVGPFFAGSMGHNWKNELHRHHLRNLRNCKCSTLVKSEHLMCGALTWQPNWMGSVSSSISSWKRRGIGTTIHFCFVWWFYFLGTVWFGVDKIKCLRSNNLSLRKTWQTWLQHFSNLSTCFQDSFRHTTSFVFFSCKVNNLYIMFHILYICIYFLKQLFRTDLGIGFAVFKFVCQTISLPSQASDECSCTCCERVDLNWRVVHWLIGFVLLGGSSCLNNQLWICSVLSISSTSQQNISAKFTKGQCCDQLLVISSLCWKLLWQLMWLHHWFQRKVPSIGGPLKCGYAVLILIR